MCKYFHEIPDEEVADLLQRKVNIGYINEHYKRPPWCEDEGALDGKYGCWSLMDLYGERHKISHEFCARACDTCKPIGDEQDN